MTANHIEQQEHATLPPVMFRRWLHSREEDGAGIEVYRPESFPFPPAFARDAFTMRPDGRFIQEDTGPADEIVRVPGHWRLAAPRRVSVRFVTDRPGFTFDVLDVDDTVLRVHRLGKHPEPVAPEADVAAFLAKPPPTAFRLIAFDEATVADGVLRVSGTKPFANMRVDLVPVVYVRQPDFWEIEVVGSLPGVGLPALAPYTVSRSLAGSVGRCGIEVVGSNRRQRFDIRCDSEEM